MGPIERAVRASVSQGDRLLTPSRGAPFVVKMLDQQGIVLLLGVGEWPTRVSWDCLEGIREYLDGHGWSRIGSKYETAAEPGSLDAYLKRFTKTATAGWVAALLERADVVEIDRSPPARIRLRRGKSR